MKKYLNLIILQFFFFGAMAQAPANKLQLPLTYVDGYGPYFQAMAGLSWDDENPLNSWFKTYKDIKGIPPSWTAVKKGIIFFDIRQFAYQNYATGNISKDFYIELQNCWNWKPDTTLLSKTPINCFVYVVRGKNSAGKQMLVVDSQGNLDVADDTPFEPVKHPRASTPPLKETIQVAYQKLIGGKVTDLKAPIMLKNDSSMLWFNIPRHAKAQFRQNGRNYDLNISNDFISDDFSEARITLAQNKITTMQGMDSISNKGEYITIGKKIYRNNGVIADRLELEEITDTLNLRSTQVGFKAINFKGKQMDNGEELSLDSYKGKYLFIDFWGTWCGPCVGELPNLKKAYDSLDKTRIAFLGIASGDTPQSLKPVMEKNKVDWPQIISDKANNIVAAYNVKGFPTTYLIDPQGKIVAKNLRGSMLEKYLTDLLARKKSL